MKWGFIYLHILIENIPKEEYNEIEKNAKIIKF